MPSVQSSSKIKAGDPCLALSLLIRHNITIGTASTTLYKKRTLGDIDVYAPPSGKIRVLLEGSLNRQKAGNDTIATSKLAQHLEEYFKANATALGLNTVSPLVAMEKEQGSPSGIILTLARCSAPTLRQAVLPQEARAVLTEFSLSFIWSTRTSTSTEAKTDILHTTDPFSSTSVSLPCRLLLENVIERFVTFQVVKRYPLIFGPWIQQLDIEHTFFPKIFQSISAIIQRSPNPEFQYRARALLTAIKKTQKTEIRNALLGLCTTLENLSLSDSDSERLASIDANTHTVRISEEEAFGLAMDGLYRRGMKKFYFKGKGGLFSVNKSQEESENEGFDLYDGHGTTEEYTTGNREIDIGHPPSPRARNSTLFHNNADSYLDKDKYQDKDNIYGSQFHTYEDFERTFPLHCDFATPMESSSQLPTPVPTASASTSTPPTAIGTHVYASSPFFPDPICFSRLVPVTKNPIITDFDVTMDSNSSVLEIEGTAFAIACTRTPATSGADTDLEDMDIDLKLDSDPFDADIDVNHRSQTGGTADKDDLELDSDTGAGAGSQNLMKQSLYQGLVALDSSDDETDYFGDHGESAGGKALYEELKNEEFDEDEYLLANSNSNANTTSFSSYASNMARVLSQPQDGAQGNDVYVGAAKTQIGDEEHLNVFDSDSEKEGIPDSSDEWFESCFKLGGSRPGGSQDTTTTMTSTRHTNSDSSQTSWESQSQPQSQPTLLGISASWESLPLPVPVNPHPFTGVTSQTGEKVTADGPGVPYEDPLPPLSAGSKLQCGNLDLSNYDILIQDSEGEDAQIALAHHTDTSPRANSDSDILSLADSQFADGEGAQTTDDSSRVSITIPTKEDMISAIPDKITIHSSNLSSFSSIQHPSFSASDLQPSLVDTPSSDDPSSDSNSSNTAGAMQSLNSITSTSSESPDGQVTIDRSRIADTATISIKSGVKRARSVSVDQDPPLIRSRILETQQWTGSQSQSQSGPCTKIRNIDDMEALDLDLDLELAEDEGEDDILTEKTKDPEEFEFGLESSVDLEFVSIIEEEDLNFNNKFEGLPEMKSSNAPSKHKSNRSEDLEFRLGY